MYKFELVSKYLISGLAEQLHHLAPPPHPLQYRFLWHNSHHPPAKMGWLWTSSKSQDKPQEDLQDQPSLPPSTEPPFPTEEPLPPPSPDPAEAQQEPRSAPQNRYEFADAELRNLILKLAAEDAASLPHNELFANSPFRKLFRRSTRTTNTPTSSDENVDEDAPTSLITDVPQDRKITPANIYPTTMSCRAAFDAAFYCQSLGGQFNAVYHYGTIRDCSPHWSQFWFCVKTNRRPMSDEERQGRVMEHYRMREMKYREGPSSEDVWVQRTTMLEKAFSGDRDAAVALEEKIEKQMALALEEKRRGESTGK